MRPGADHRLRGPGAPGRPALSRARSAPAGSLGVLGAVARKAGPRAPLRYNASTGPAMTTSPRPATVPDKRANLFGLEREALARAIAPLTERGFHAGQIYHWIYGRGVADFAAMTDLPAAMPRGLEGRLRSTLPEASVAGHSSDGSCKYVVGFPDGREVESVRMVHGDRVTLCLSTQVGCPLACGFCLTGTMGLVRNLTAGEIVAQVALLARAHGDAPPGLRLVFMGMGEPLNNYSAVMAAFRILVDPEGYAIPPRRITLSTV